jgi:biopolymer transport protein ExbD
MRRFSQRNSLVTLSDINITPLLDLAFVLLIIFIITTPLLEKGLDLKLPKAGGQSSKVEQKDIRTVEIDPRGFYFMNKRQMQLNQLVPQLVQDFKYNPNLVVNIRADENSRAKEIYALIDACQRNGITRYSLRTQPEGK